ncbi:MAG: hypothetical protein ACRC7O_11055, partial [Fimbriiglobus sp.]
APPDPLYAVSGSVLLKGKPIAGARVSFLGGPQSNPVSCAALTIDDGTFSCQSYMSLQGLPEGIYSVRVTWPDSPSLEPYDGERDRLNYRYNSVSKPPFSVTVKSGMNTLPPFDLK